MTPALRTARCLTAAAALSSASAAYLVATGSYWFAVGVVYVAGVLAWCASRDYARHRRIQLQALGRALTAIGSSTACCHLAEHSDGQAHNPSCLRRPTSELYATCCIEAFVSRGAQHESTCPSRTTRSSAA
ncbi:hypothetical protein ACIRJS_32860 [Streptomyces sp. NPDC102340]|uniref:hypothetical protein n=1 Tax=unclassified Streptomyces TaxID=2593676 RepID=UPI0037F95A01